MFRFQKMGIPSEGLAICMHRGSKVLGYSGRRSEQGQKVYARVTARAMEELQYRTYSRVPQSRACIH